MPIFLDQKADKVDIYTKKEIDSKLENIGGGTSSLAKDLSMFDIHGVAFSTQNTANCYVVKTNGTYKFPLVYGNAIKEGASNTAAYTRIGTNSVEHEFVNHKGNTLTSPYIENNTDCVASSCDIVWQDSENMITNISIVEGTPCRYLQFDANIPDINGNAIVAIKDVSENIIWSWHIWCCTDDLTPLTFENYTNVGYNLLPYNLGWKWDSSDKKYGKNVFYQWGRKDPMPCSASYNSTSNITLYGSYSYNTSTKQTNLFAGILHPYTFYTNSSSPYNWFGSASYYNLWDANCTTTGTSDNITIKTIYDPCPVGFKVPNGRTFTGFTTTGSNSSNSSEFNKVGNFNYGWNFKKTEDDTVGNFFPASGCWYGSSGVLRTVGSNGYCWSSAAYSETYACRLYFDSSSIYPLNYGSRSCGFSVRPVAEF